MEFLQFVELIRRGVTAAEIVASQGLPSDAEEIGVYMKHQVSLTSQLAFFDLERVPPYVFLTIDGQQYEAFFSASELADFIPEYAASLGAAATPLAIAEAILHYLRI